MKYLVREMYQCDISCNHTDLSKEKTFTISLEEALGRINDPAIHAEGYQPYNSDDELEVSSLLHDYCDLEVVKTLA